MWLNQEFLLLQEPILAGLEPAIYVVDIFEKHCWNLKVIL